MDKIKKYKTTLEDIFKYQASIQVSNTPNTKMHLFIGQEKEHFILMNIGWQGKRYHHTLFFNVEIINNKIWIHEDNTDIDLVGKLLDSGIPKSDIVLGFVPVYARDIEGFAVG